MEELSNATGGHSPSSVNTDPISSADPYSLRLVGGTSSSLRLIGTLDLEDDPPVDAMSQKLTSSARAPYTQLSFVRGGLPYLASGLGAYLIEGGQVGFGCPPARGCESWPTEEAMTQWLGLDAAKGVF